MRYKDRYTGMGQFACLLIDKPLSQKSEHFLEVSDQAGRQWLCCDMGKPAMEATAIVVIYDSLVCGFAEAVGEPIGARVLARSTAEEALWQKWYGRLRFVHTPSVEALAQILSQEPTPGPRWA